MLPSFIRMRFCIVCTIGPKMWSAILIDLGNSRSSSFICDGFVLSTQFGVYVSIAIFTHKVCIVFSPFLVILLIYGAVDDVLVNFSNTLRCRFSYEAWCQCFIHQFLAWVIQFLTYDYVLFSHHLIVNFYRQQFFLVVQVIFIRHGH